MSGVILAPLPIKLDSGDPGRQLPMGWMLVPMDSGLRAALRSATRKHESNQSLMVVLHEAESAVIAPLLEPSIIPTSPLVSAAFYRAVAQEAWTRMARSMYLVSNIVPPTHKLCWFFAPGSVAAI